jgi:hypothetical protein
VRLQSCRPPFTFLFDSLPYPPQPAAIALITPRYPPALPVIPRHIARDHRPSQPNTYPRPPEQPDRLSQKPHALLDTHSYSPAVSHCSPRWVRVTASPWCSPTKVRYLEGVMAGHWSDRPRLHQDGEGRGSYPARCASSSGKTPASRLRSSTYGKMKVGLHTNWDWTAVPRTSRA